MEPCRPCSRCKQKKVILDSSSGTWVCTSCGTVQQFDDFRSDYEAGFNVPTGTLVRSCSSGRSFISQTHGQRVYIQGSVNYRENKIFHAQKEIEDLTSKLDLTGARSRDVREMIEKITEGEYGQGNWFEVLIAAVSYIVIRKHHLPPSLSEVCASLGCDIHEVGRMVSRVTDFLDLKLPEFNMMASLERAVNSCPSFAGVRKDKADIMIKQGRFLLTCCVKWFLTTGRQPLPVVTAVLTFVAEVNEVNVALEDIAKDLYASVVPSKLRYRELKETLVKVAQALPWGKDVNAKNLVRNMPSILRYMEMKLKFKPTSHSKPGIPVEFNPQEVLAECLQKQIEYREDGYHSSREDDTNYLDMESRIGYLLEKMDDIDKLKLSQECLWNTYRELANISEVVRPADKEALKDNTRKRKRITFGGRHLDYWMESFDLDGQLTFEHVMKNNFGFDALPPSFVAGKNACKRRREKIIAAKQRINKVMQPSQINRDTSSEKLEPQKECNVDWEDCIIELLILHRASEEEIEQGHYNTLLDLHVFNYVEKNQKTSAL